MHRRLLTSLAFAAALLAPGAAHAQDLGEALANALINSINRASINRARETWSGVSPDVQACLQSRHRLNVEQMINEGIRATDRRLREPIATCEQQAEQQRLIAARQEELRLADEAAEAQRQAEIASAAEAARQARQAQYTQRYGATMANAILSGQVLTGMTREQLIAARGQPGRREQLTPTDEIWYYGAQRIGLANGRVAFVR